MIDQWLRRGCCALMVAMLMLTVGCGDSAPAATINGGGGDQTNGSDGNGADGIGSENDSEERSGFEPTEFVYQSGDRELSLIRVEDIDADPPQIGRQVLYEHPYDINSFELLRDRTGIIFTADRDYTDSYHTQAGYVVDLTSQEVVPLVEPVETEPEVSTLRVEASLGGVTDRIWFTIHESQIDSSGNMVAYRIPASLDGGGVLETHPPACNSFSRLTPDPAGERLAVLEQFCNNNHDTANLAVYDGPDLQGRSVVAKQDDTAFDMRIPGSVDWLSDTQIMMSLGNGDLALFDVQGQEPPSVVGENIVSNFTFSPDRSMFAGVANGQLLVTTVPDFETWYVVAEDALDRAPSW